MSHRFTPYGRGGGECAMGDNCVVYPWGAILGSSPLTGNDTEVRVGGGGDFELTGMECFECVCQLEQDGLDSFRERKASKRWGKSERGRGS